MRKILGTILGVYFGLVVQVCYAVDKFDVLPDLPEPLANAAQASSVSTVDNVNNLAAQSTSLTKMGNIYTDMYEQEAMDYYSIASDLAEQTDNSRVKGFVSSSLAGAYERFGEPQEALKSYSKAVKHYTDAEAPLKVAQNYNKAADIMVEYGNSAKAKSLLQKAQNYARQTDDVNLMNEINDKLSTLA